MNLRRKFSSTWFLTYKYAYGKQIQQKSLINFSILRVINKSLATKPKTTQLTVTACSDFDNLFGTPQWNLFAVFFLFQDVWTCFALSTLCFVVHSIYTYTFPQFVVGGHHIP